MTQGERSRSFAGMGGSGTAASVLVEIPSPDAESAETFAGV